MPEAVDGAVLEAERNDAHARLAVHEQIEGEVLHKELAWSSMRGVNTHQRRGKTHSRGEAIAHRVRGASRGPCDPQRPHNGSPEGKVQ